MNVERFDESNESWSCQTNATGFQANIATAKEE